MSSISSAASWVSSFLRNPSKHSAQDHPKPDEELGYIDWLKQKVNLRRYTEDVKKKKDSTMALLQSIYGDAAKAGKMKSLVMDLDLKEHGETPESRLLYDHRLNQSLEDDASNVMGHMMLSAMHTNRVSFPFLERTADRVRFLSERFAHHTFDISRHGIPDIDDLSFAAHYTINDCEELSRLAIQLAAAGHLDQTLTGLLMINNQQPSTHFAGAIENSMNWARWVNADNLCNLNDQNFEQYRTSPRSSHKDSIKRPHESQRATEKIEGLLSHLSYLEDHRSMDDREREVARELLDTLSDLFTVDLRKEQTWDTAWNIRLNTDSIDETILAYSRIAQRRRGGRAQKVNETIDRHLRRVEAANKPRRGL